MKYGKGHKKRLEFILNGESVKKRIASWPKWKRTPLGDVPRMPTFKSVSDNGDEK